jgi:ribonuclease PH
MERANGRKWNEIREVTITRNFLKYPEGSVLIEMGDTMVICTVTMEDNVPPFLKNSGKGWLTAEYSMFPMSTQTRSVRESTRRRISGRTHEIQRLIGRSLRAVTDLTSFGEKTIYVDCDVIQADGGTRTISITGSFVALIDAFRKWKEEGVVDRIPVRDFVSAISVGVVDDDILLDLDYQEDSSAQVDMNFVMTREGLIIEVQGTAEEFPFSRNLLDEMTDLATGGIANLTHKQMEILGELTCSK